MASPFWFCVGGLDSTVSLLAYGTNDFTNEPKKNNHNTCSTACVFVQPADDVQCVSVNKSYHVFRKPVMTIAGTRIKTANDD